MIVFSAVAFVTLLSMVAGATLFFVLRNFANEDGVIPFVLTTFLGCAGMISISYLVLSFAGGA